MKDAIVELCGQIKNRLSELGMSEFVLYSYDYCGDIDEDDERLEDLDSTLSLDWRFNIQESYDGYSAIYNYVRKVKIKDDEDVFDLDIVYEDNDGGWELQNSYKDQTIEDILRTCPENMVIECLNGILKYGLNDSTIVELNRK